MKNLSLILIAFVMLVACNDEKRITFPLPSQTKSFLHPVMLQEDSTILELQDYFLHPEKIVRITLDKSLSSKMIMGNKVVLNYTGEPVPSMSVMRIWYEDTAYSVILRKSIKVEKIIKFEAKGQDVHHVSIAGDFNSWNASINQLRRVGDVWETTLKLLPGKFAYQLVVNGNWILDPANPDTLSNNMGGVNSVMKVGEVDNPKAPNLFVNSSEGNSIIVKYENQPDSIFVLWENFQIVSKLIDIDTVKKEIRFPIPENTKDIARSHMRVFSYNEFGVSNDLLIPLNFNKVVSDISELNRKDYEASSLYFILVDRFNNGDKSIDQPVNDPEVLSKANYYGGDIKGILDKVKDGYFTKLGINTLWISPIVQNPEIAYYEFPEPHRKFSGYHGYWPINSSQIDHRFGDDKVFQELVDEAHKRNINVLIDYVSNHVHEDNPIIKAHPDWKTQLDLPDGTKNIRIWDAQRLTTWFDTFIPSLDYSKPEVVDTMTSLAVDWVTKYNLDGFRHDATKHVPEVFWRTLTKKLKEQVIYPKNERLYQIGETFGSRELIGSYIGSGMLDAQFDFNLYFDARAAFAKDDESLTKLEHSLKETFVYYGNHHLMGNVSGNHDIPRFISYAGEALRFDEDDKEAGWRRDIKVENPVGYEKLKMLFAFTFTIPGVPVVFYGDEIGMPGAGDPDNRRMMIFDNSKLNQNEISVRDMVTKLSNFRKNSLALNYGDYKTLLITDKQWVFARKYLNETVIVVMNKNNTKTTISFKIPEILDGENPTTLFNTKIAKKSNVIDISLDKYSFEIITIKQ